MTAKSRDQDQERTEASPPRNEVRAQQQPAREGPLDPRWPADDPRQSMSNPHIPAAPQESPGDLPSINEPPGSAPGSQPKPTPANVSHETPRDHDDTKDNKRHR